jgi:hypothetical protein
MGRLGKPTGPRFGDDHVVLEAIVDPVADQAFELSPARQLIGRGHGLDTQDKRHRPPTCDVKILGSEAPDKLTRESEAGKSGQPSLLALTVN